MNPINCRDVRNRPQLVYVSTTDAEVVLSLLPKEISRLRPQEAQWLAEALTEAARELGQP